VSSLTTMTTPVRMTIALLLTAGAGVASPLPGFAGRTGSVDATGSGAAWSPRTLDSGPARLALTGAAVLASDGKAAGGDLWSALPPAPTQAGDAPAPPPFPLPVPGVLTDPGPGPGQSPGQNHDSTITGRSGPLGSGGPAGGDLFAGSDARTLFDLSAGAIGSPLGRKRPIDELPPESPDEGTVGGLTVAPLPPAGWVGGGSLGLLAGSRLIRRRHRS
jgi:hypothetical protein